MLPIIFGFAAAASSAPTSAVEPRTADAVIAADRAWSTAEQSGDADFLQGLLDPTYVSVSGDGKFNTKDQIVEHARKRTSSDLAKLREEVAAWKAEHPNRADVAIVGDTAVLKWVAESGKVQGAVRSSDIFIYRAGHWHPIYSQHSSASD